MSCHTKRNLPPRLIRDSFKNCHLQARSSRRPPIPRRSGEFGKVPGNFFPTWKTASAALESRITSTSNSTFPTSSRIHIASEKRMKTQMDCIKHWSHRHLELACFVRTPRMRGSTRHKCLSRWKVFRVPSDSELEKEKIGFSAAFPRPECALVSSNPHRRRPKAALLLIFNFRPHQLWKSALQQRCTPKKTRDTSER